MERCHRAVLLTLQRNILIIEFFFYFQNVRVAQSRHKTAEIKIKMIM